MGQLFEEVLSQQNFERAYHLVEKKERRRRFWADSPICLETLIVELRKEITSGSYRPSLPIVRTANHAHRGGKKLAYHAVSFRDRIVEHAIRMILSPLYEKEFVPFSCAYRPGKGEKYFISLVNDTIRCGLGWILHLDIDSFFYSIDNALLLGEMLSFTQDEELVNLIAQCLFLEDGNRGVMPGHVLSPFLSNVFLHPVDISLKERRVIRYADDYFFAKAANSGFEEDIVALSEQLVLRGLTLNRDKIQIMFSPDSSQLLV